jgi:hypothetical protein
MMCRITCSYQKPSDPHGIGHPALFFTSPIDLSPTYTNNPANRRQKVTHGGNTAQIWEGLIKPELTHTYLSAGGPTDESCVGGK